MEDTNDTTTMENTYLIIPNIANVIDEYVGLKLEETKDDYTIRDISDTNRETIVKINRWGIGDRLYTIEHKITHLVELPNGTLRTIVDRDDIHMLNSKELRNKESILGYFRKR